MRKTTLCSFLRLKGHCVGEVVKTGLTIQIYSVTTSAYTKRQMYGAYLDEKYSLKANNG